MRVMGIDASSATGIAFADSTKSVLYAEEFKPKAENVFERGSALADRVLTLRGKYKPDVIIIEEMIVHHAASAIAIIGLGTILRYFLWQSDIKYVECGPTSLKKFAAGDGSAKKEHMMMYVLAKWGFQSASNNVADAVALAMYGLKFPEGSPKKVKKSKKKG